MLEIISNGSKWAGERPDTIDELLTVLEKHPLDRVFEGYGNFIHESNLDNIVHFWGNFQKLSHVFNVRTDKQGVIEILTQAIRQNQTMPDYLNQPDPQQEDEEEDFSFYAN